RRRAPKEVTTNSISARVAQSSIGPLGLGSDALGLWLAQSDEPARDTQLPGVVVAARRVAPAGQVAEDRPRRAGDPSVLHRWEPAGNHAREVLHAPADARGQPGRILVADPAHPPGLGPFLGRGGQRRSGWAVALQNRQPRRRGAFGSGRVPALRRRAVKIEHDLRFGVQGLDPADELERLFDLSLRIVRPAEHERELWNDAVLAAATGDLDCMLDASAPL